MMFSRNPKTFVITSGDLNGIGLEVSAKALSKIRKSKEGRLVRWIIYRSKNAPSRDLKKARSGFSKFEVHSDLLSALQSKAAASTLLEIASTQLPPLWVEEAAQAAFLGQIAGLVTAPLSKPLIKRAGLRDLGHTEILKRVCGSKTAHMGFFGEKMNVVLATGHLPLSRVPKALNKNALKKAMQSALQLRQALPGNLGKRPIGVLGLNPHAGDGGLIGSEELRWIRPLLAKNKIFQGPLVPDAAFSEKSRKAYSVFIALYHDQGLIPFKALHGHSGGAHVTLGLPIVRTSVDHGTAYDIFGKNKADAGSMLDAMKWAVRLSSKVSRKS